MRDARERRAVGDEGGQTPPALTYVSLSLCEGELLQLDSLPDDPLDPLVDDGLTM